MCIYQENKTKLGERGGRIDCVVLMYPSEGAAVADSDAANVRLQVTHSSVLIIQIMSAR